ncbi:MAG: DUF4124 domain-containing protein [Rhodanobacter sp.]
MRWFLLASMLAASLSAALGQVVYQWKDAAGSTHYTDTPPPSGATLLKGPKPVAVRASAANNKPMLQTKCRPDISAADCAAARNALQADLEDLARSAPTAQGSAGGTESDATSKLQLARMRADSCSESRAVLAVLQRRQNNVDVGEQLTVDDRASIPGQIEEAGQRIAHFCD